jgi:flagellar biosynthesis anti-sigma factor FlgM
MPDRINGQGFRPMDAGATRRTETAKQVETEPTGASGPQSSASAEAGTVKLTRSAVLLSRLADVVRNAPAADAGRVRAIKEKLASGSYRIDDQSIADQMIRMDRELPA